MKEQELLVKAVKFRIAMQENVKNRVNTTGEKYKEDCKKMSDLFNEWAKYYVVNFINERTEEETRQHRKMYMELLNKGVPNGESFELIRKHAKELNEIALRKEKELKGE